MVDIDLTKIKTEKPVKASKIKRILALIFDLLIIDFIIIGAFEGVFKKIMPDISYSSITKLLEYDVTQATQLANLLTVISVLMLAYFVFSQYKTGQTLGMLVFGLKIETLNGEPLRFWQCFVRNLVIMPLFPFILLWIIDPIYFFVTGDRFSEIVSKTKTVQVNTYG